MLLEEFRAHDAGRALVVDRKLGVGPGCRREYAQHSGGVVASVPVHLVIFGVRGLRPTKHDLEGSRLHCEEPRDAYGLITLALILILLTRLLANGLTSCLRLGSWDLDLKDGGVRD